MDGRSTLTSRRSVTSRALALLAAFDEEHRSLSLSEQSDPSSYVEGHEIPVWVLHGLSDPLLPFNQSRLVYDATTGEGNEARFTLVPGAGHSVTEIIDAEEATTRSTNRGGHERVVEGTGPSWDDIEHFVHVNLNRSRSTRPRA